MMHDDEFICGEHGVPCENQNEQLDWVERMAVSARNYPFTHLIAVDIQTTHQQVHYHESEIIEFTAVVVDMRSGVVFDEIFHFYVTPVEEPELSDTCMNRTGVSQSQVDQGIDLSTCLKKFKTWRRHLNRVFISTAIVSWGHLNFLTLKHECLRKRIKQRKCFDKWIDLLPIYQDFKQTRQEELEAACEAFAITIENIPYRGIVNAKQIADLAWRLHDNGASVCINSNIVCHD